MTLPPGLQSPRFLFFIYPHSPYCALRHTSYLRMSFSHCFPAGGVDLQPFGYPDLEVRLSGDSREAIILVFDLPLCFDYKLSAAEFTHF